MNNSLYKYRFKHIRTIDGDTVEGEVDLGFGVRIIQKFRLANINTPELNSKDALVADRANNAKLFTNNFFVEADLNKKTVILGSEKPLKEDKYGRYLGTFYKFAPKENTDNLKSLNEVLLESGFAEKY